MCDRAKANAFETAEEFCTQTQVDPDKEKSLQVTQLCNKGHGHCVISIRKICVLSKSSNQLLRVVKGPRLCLRIFNECSRLLPI